MNLLGNIIWVVFGGIVIFLEYLVAGLALCATIVGIPFGIQCIKLSLFALFPFGKRVVDRKSAGGAVFLLMNIIWILIGGIWIALSHALFGIVFAITIIGIPFAKQHFRLAVLAFTPFGKEVRKASR